MRPKKAKSKLYGDKDWNMVRMTARRICSSCSSEIYQEVKVVEVKRLGCTANAPKVNCFGLQLTAQLELIAAFICVSLPTHCLLSSNHLAAVVGAHSICLSAPVALGGRNPVGSFQQTTLWR